MHLKDGLAPLGQDARMKDEIGYHSSRALAELDRARSCPDLRAARVHFELAERHLERLRSLGAARPAPGPTTAT